MPPLRANVLFEHFIISFCVFSFFFTFFLIFFSGILISYAAHSIQILKVYNLNFFITKESSYHYFWFFLSVLVSYTFSYNYFFLLILLILFSNIYYFQDFPRFLFLSNKIIFSFTYFFIFWLNLKIFYYKILGLVYIQKIV